MEMDRCNIWQTDSWATECREPNSPTKVPFPRLLLLLLLLSSICWTPYILYQIEEAMCEGSPVREKCTMLVVSSWSRIIFQWFIYSNSFIDPFLCLTMHRKFRQAFLRACQCVWSFSSHRVHSDKSVSPTITVRAATGSTVLSQCPATGSTVLSQCPATGSSDKSVSSHRVHSDKSVSNHRVHSDKSVSSHRIHSAKLVSSHRVHSVKSVSPTITRWEVVLTIPERREASRQKTVLRETRGSAQFVSL
ncbi:hypothetical protein ACOMHN_037813 [Nucella lapillus]